MFDTFDLDRSNGCAFDRRKQCSAQGISHGRPEAPLKWLGREASVTFGQGFRVSRQTTRHLKSGPEIILIHKRTVRKFEEKLRCPACESDVARSGAPKLLAIKLYYQLLVNRAVNVFTSRQSRNLSAHFRSRSRNP